MTSQQMFDQAETEFVEARERFKPVVYARVEAMVLERYPDATGYTVTGEFVDDFLDVQLASVLFEEGDSAIVFSGENEFLTDEDENWAYAVSNVLSWLDVVDPNEWHRGGEITFERG